MIDKVFLKEIGLSEEQTGKILDAVQCERVYHSLLHEAGIPPRIAQKIVDITALDEVLGESVDLMRLKVQETWKDFIAKKQK